MSDLVETGEPKPKSGAPSTVDLEAGGQHGEIYENKDNDKHLKEEDGGAASKA